VKYALDSSAIETLMVSDKLFRAKNIKVRKEYVLLVERAEKNGIKTVIFSSMNRSGESKG
jgi:protein pelota